MEKTKVSPKPGGKELKPKNYGKDMIALSFLSGITMQRETSIRQTGYKNYILRKKDEDNRGNSFSQNELAIDENCYYDLNNNSSTHGLFSLEEDQINLPGKRLRGPLTYMVNFPLNQRFQLLKLTENNSSLQKQWEDQILKKNTDMQLTQADQSLSILNSRMFFSMNRSYPLLVSSIIKYDAGEEKARMNKIYNDAHRGIEVFILPTRDWRGNSYKKLFKPLKEERLDDYFYEKGYLYDPDLLDDPSLLYGCHHYKLEATNKTGPIISSILVYVNKDVLKDELNLKFQEDHETLPASLTLSKIRNVKKKLLYFALHINLELSTVSMAFIHFERLCLQGIVTKFNRKLTMAVCVILSFKFNENLTHSSSKRLGLLFTFFDQEWNLPKKDIIAAEFGAYVKLNFALHIPNQHIQKIYSNILKMINNTSRAYLGSKMYKVYRNDLNLLEKWKEDMEEIVNEIEMKKQEELEKQEKEEKEEREREEAEAEAQAEKEAEAEAILQQELEENDRQCEENEENEGDIEENEEEITTNHINKSKSFIPNLTKSKSFVNFKLLGTNNQTSNEKKTFLSSFFNNTKSSKSPKSSTPNDEELIQLEDNPADDNELYIENYNTENEDYEYYPNDMDNETMANTTANAITTLNYTPRNEEDQ